MTGEKNLETLLKKLSPKLHRDEFVFMTVNGKYGDYEHLDPIAFFMEEEGMTLVVPRKKALSEGLHSDSVFRKITLTVHSSLESVGLTAAVSEKLAAEGISANVIAAYYHDHIFVPSEQARKAEAALKKLSS